MMVGRMVEDFAAEIQTILERERFLSPNLDGGLQVPAVYAHALPSPNKNRDNRSPWVLIKAYNGSQPSADQPQTVTLHITDMVVDVNEDMQGCHDALQLLETICRNLYSQSFVAGKYEVVYPYQFALLDDVRYPHFSAGLAIKVELHGIAPQNRIGGNAYV